MSRILVVDDDHAIRESVRIALSSVGIEVIGADCGERAIELFARNRFDGVIVDLMMPGIDGIETIQALRAIEPGLPAVIISGALMRDPSAPDFMRLGTRLHGVVRLAKPFTLADLLRTVHNCVAVAA